MDSHHMPDATLPVFVYGTLRPGQVNWPVAEPFCVDHEPAHLPGHALYALDYPCAVGVARTDAASSDGDTVHGDLLWLDPAQAITALNRLDLFEGYDDRNPERSYYRRDRRQVRTVASRQLDAWVYLPGSELLRQVSDERRVPGGEWLGHT